MQWRVECMNAMKSGVYDCNGEWSVRMQWMVECMTAMESI